MKMEKIARIGQQDHENPALDRGNGSASLTPPPQFQKIGDDAVSRMLAAAHSRPDQPIPNELFRAVIHQLGSVLTTDLAGRITHANETFCNLNKCSLDTILGKRPSLFKSGLHDARFYRSMWDAMNLGQVWHGEICNRALDGSLHWVEAWICPLVEPSGKPGGYVSYRLDITARKQAEIEASSAMSRCQRAETLLTDIVDTLPSGVIAHDSAGRVIFRNYAYRNLYAGHPAHPLPPADRPANAASTPTPGHPLEQLGTIVGLPDDKWVKTDQRRSQTGNTVSVWTDVTDLKRAMRDVRHQAEHDELTGLGNRRKLLNAIDELLAAGGRHPPSGMLVMIDIDHFKTINDGLGHAAGDAYLRHVAACMTAGVRRRDLVARLGGDEFAVLIRGRDGPVKTDAVIGRLRSALRKPVRLGRATVVPAVSMGVCAFTGENYNSREIFNSADLALHHCKRHARGSYLIFRKAMLRDQRRRMALGERLKDALARNELIVAMQPQRDLLTGRHTGFEALVRWNLRGNWIPPETLISIAEETDLICEVSNAIMDKALGIHARLRGAGHDPGRLGINIVTAQLHQPDFVTGLDRMLRRHRVKASEVELEVAENVILDRSGTRISKVLQAASDAGVSIALDDFGMGYASLTHLKNFPLDRLKIDRSFVGGMMERDDDRIIVQTIISLARNLGLDIVAEGVETEQQQLALIRLGCDVGQGYLLGRPLIGEQIDAYYRQLRDPAEAARPAWPQARRGAEGVGACS